MARRSELQVAYLVAGDRLMEVDQVDAARLLWGLFEGEGRSRADGQRVEGCSWACAAGRLDQRKARGKQSAVAVWAAGLSSVMLQNLPSQPAVAEWNWKRQPAVRS